MVMSVPLPCSIDVLMAVDMGSIGVAITEVSMRPVSAITITDSRGGIAVAISIAGVAVVIIVGVGRVAISVKPSVFMWPAALLRLGPSHHPAST